MNVLGVPMRYDFDIHHFGPFCAHVMHDVDWLLADEVIVDHSQEKKRYSNYRPGPGWSELSAQYHDTLSAHQQKIEAVCRALGSLAHHDLELVATLDFSFRWVRAGGGGGPWRARTIEKFKSIKKDKFPNAEIDSWYDALVGAGLIEA